MYKSPIYDPVNKTLIHPETFEPLTRIGAIGAVDAAQLSLTQPAKAGATDAQENPKELSGRLTKVISKPYGGCYY